MTTIVATPGAANANSFITEAEYIAFIASRLNVPADSTLSGSAATEDEKKAMVEATRELTVLKYSGYRPSSTQSLSWPRAYAVNPDIEQILPGGSTSDLYFADNIIPQRVKDATCEMALQFRKAGTTDIASSSPKDNIKRDKTGPLETEYFDRQDQVRGLARYPRVASLIQPLLASSAGAAELARQ